MDTRINIHDPSLKPRDIAAAFEKVANKVGMLSYEDKKTRTPVPLDEFGSTLSRYQKSEPDGGSKEK